MTARNTPSALAALSAEQRSQLTALARSLNAQQRAWVAGFLSGIDWHPETGADGADTSATETDAVVLYGSETGTAKKIANDLCQAAQRQGISLSLHDLGKYRPRNITRERYVVLITSTHGDGDPPANATAFHRYLMSRRAPRLEALKFAVLALGDSSYEKFCATGREFDDRLTALGAEYFVPLQECDIDYQDAATTWTQNVLAKLLDLLPSAPKASNIVPLNPSHTEILSTAPSSQAVEIELLDKQKITGRDSDRDVHHLEFGLHDDRTSYAVGDTIAFHPANDPTNVERLLMACGIDRDTEVELGDRRIAIDDALTHQRELTRIDNKFLSGYAEAIGDQRLAAIANDETRRREFIPPRDVVAVVETYPGRIEAQELVTLLRPLQARRYSIASAQSAVDDELHLTVKLVEFTAFERRRYGAASSHLCRHIEIGAQLSATIETNARFHLPSDRGQRVIMVGPGVGIAPYRGFLQAKACGQYQGPLWLFFGNPHLTQDFLYQSEILAWRDEGVLDRLSVAFSRDGAEKIYVQNRLCEAGKDIYAWLNEGAYFYVCGDASHMAHDVENALIAIAQRHGCGSREMAEDWVLSLHEQGRYRQDVY